MPAWAGYAVLGALAALENVFPPVPADTAVGIGAFLTHYGTFTVGIVFAVVWSANVSSAAGMYAAARVIGRPFFQTRIGHKLLAPRRLQRIEDLYARYGTWGIFFSRFIPGVRAVVPPFAGIAGVGVGRALVPVAAASAIWYGALTFVVARLAGTIEEAVRIVAGLNTLLLVLGGIVVLAMIVWLLHRRGSDPQDLGERGRG